MAVNKVIYGNRVIIDISGSTVTPETLGEGVIAFNAKGEMIEGTAGFSPGSLTDISTEEVYTGVKWLNGKRIYAKTLVHTGAAYSLDLPEGVEMAWLDTTNSFHINANGVSYPPYATINNINYFVCILSTSNVVYKTNATTGGDFYIRVLYTKDASAEAVNSLDTDKLDTFILA